MPSIYDLKPKFQNLLRPNVKRMAAAGVTANQVTVAAMVLSIACGALVACYPNSRWALLTIPIVLLLRMALNAVDGMLAREFDQKSRLGAVLNELGDVISDVALYLPLALVSEIDAVAIIFFVIVAVIVEFTGVVAIQIGSERRYEGPMGKSDRAFWIGLLAVLAAIGWISRGGSAIYVWVLIGMSVVTVIKRVRRALDDRGSHSPSSLASLAANPMIATLEEPVEPIVPIESDAVRKPIETSFRTSDGHEIFYRVWKPDSPSHNAVMLFHRGHEHSGRWQEFVDTSGLDDCWFFAWDARGHGMTSGPRGAAESFSVMVRDADEFAKHICETYGLNLCNTSVVGQSVGAVLAAAWIHDYAPPIRSMVLATPALRIRLYVPFAVPGLRLLDKLRPGSFIKSYVRPGLLTKDEKQAEAYADDPLISPRIAVNILLDLHDTSTRLMDDASALHTPTLMFVSGRDYVVSKEAQHRFFDNLSSQDKELVVLDDFYHSTFWEAGREKVISQAADFIRQRFDDDPEPRTSQELSAGSFAKYESYRQPSSVWRSAWFAIQRLGLNTVARLSKGVRIGWESGFDSGQSLDHVYRNRAEGSAFIGKLIDRGYLDSIGWKGIRQRKIHMEILLDDTITRAVDRFGSVTIMDIAAGPGRYVLETLKRNEDLPVTAILCDRDPGGIAEGRQIAKELGLEERATFQESDAFDPEKLRSAAGDRTVHIGIVSGLYELFPENEMVSRSLQGLADVIVQDGWLLYTDQPWHPQQEMIARVLPNRDGEPWVMRCRSQAEMDALVREAGLQRESLLIDRWGIFSVALARKRVSRI